MIKIEKEDREILRKYIDPNIIDSDDVNDLLLEIHWLIVTKGLTKDQQSTNDFGKQLENVYDRVFEMN